MHKITLLLLVVAATSCDDDRHKSVRVSTDASAVRCESSYWFPKMSEIPPIVPAVPDDFIPGVVTSKYVGDGKPTLVWGRVDNIRSLNEGATYTSPIFVITELDGSEEPMVITPANREEFISNYAAAGFSDIKCGTGRIDGGTMEWSSMRLANDYSLAFDLSKPGRRNRIVVSLLAGEAGLPVWEKVLNSITRSEQGGGGNALEPPSHPSTAPSKTRATP